MTPSTWNWLGKEPGTTRKRKRIQENMKSTSKKDASIFKHPTLDKTTSKTSSSIFKNVSEVSQFREAPINDPSISKHRLDETPKNLTVSEVGLVGYVRQGMGEKGTYVNILPGGIAARQAQLCLPGECYSSRCLSGSCEDTSDLDVATKLRSNCDMEELSMKPKPDGIRFKSQMQPIDGLGFSNTNCQDSLDPVSSPVSNHSFINGRDLKTLFSCPPIIHNYPFLNHQNLHEYSNPLTIVLGSDGVSARSDNKEAGTLVGSMHRELIPKYQNSPTILPSSDDTIMSNSAHSDKESKGDSTHHSSQVLDTERSLVTVQESSLTSETRTSCEDLKNERSTTSIGKCAKIWRPFVDQNCESRRSSSRGSTEVCMPVPHYVRLREEFKGYAMAISPLGIGVLRGSSTSSFRPVRRKRSHCNFCPMSFNNNGQLAGHMRIHTGDKPFKCDSCAKAFARNEELTRHKRIHSGLRPHVCDICSKKFGRKDHLNKHRKTHLKTSEKKIFHCLYEGCGHSYTRSDALTRHQSTAHNIRHSQQPSCRGGPKVRQARVGLQKRPGVIVGP